MKDGLRSAAIIDGKAIAAALRTRVAGVARGLTRPPGLALVRVGEDPASAAFIRSKARAAAECGFIVTEITLGRTDQAPATLARLNRDDAIDGILLQLPLPDGADPSPFLAAIAPAKDVDGLHPANVGALWSGGRGLAPCTPLGCLILLRHALHGLAGRNALVIGRSALVGRPMAGVLLRQGCTVTIAHSQTQELPSLCRQAGIVIAAAGSPGLIRGDWLAPDTVVIDVGLSYPDGGRPVGDVRFEEAADRAAAITPVPGGVGPMTIAVLMLNTLVASATRQAAPLPGDILAHLPMPPPEPASTAPTTDRVLIDGLELSMRIGLHPHEREAEQAVRITIALDCERRVIDGGSWPVVCYEDVTQRIRELAQRGHVDLVEDLADQIADLCLSDPRVTRAEIQVEKIHAVPGTSSVGVRITREG